MSRAARSDLMSPPDLSPQESRENPDPQEALRPIPVWVLTVAGLLVISCAYYILRSDSGAASPYGDHTTLGDLAPKPTSAPTHATADRAPVFAPCAPSDLATVPGLRER